MRLLHNSEKIAFISKNRLPDSAPTKTSEIYSYSILSSGQHASDPNEILTNEGNGWTTQIEVRALQPQRELSPSVEFLIGAKSSCDIIFRARIFADSLSEPVVQELKLRLEVEKVSVPASELLQEVILPSG